MLASAAAFSSPISLAGLCEIASARALVPGAYGGEVNPTEVYNYLRYDGASLLVDVRTQPEWQFTGMPDLSAAQGKLAAISWKTYPNFAPNTQFFEQLAAAGTAPETPLFFLCRSGGRSLDAAIAAAAQGYHYAFNVSEGFEGEPDAARHRGTSGGWKAAALPWVQS